MSVKAVPRAARWQSPDSVVSTTGYEYSPKKAVSAQVLESLSVVAVHRSVRVKSSSTATRARRRSINQAQASRSDSPWRSALGLSRWSEFLDAKRRCPPRGFLSATAPDPARLAIAGGTARASLLGSHARRITNTFVLCQCTTPERAGRY